MRQVRLLGMVLIAVFVLSAAAFSAMASAAESAIKNLPEANAGLNWTGESDGTGGSELVALNRTTSCEKFKAEGTEEKTHPLGLFHILFEKCTSEGLTCTGLGDEAGKILALGTWHLVYDKITPELLVGLLFLFEHIHYVCAAIVLILILGNVLCLHLEPLSEKLSHLFHCHQKEALPLETLYWTDLTGEHKEIEELLCKIGAGAYEHCAWLALGLIKHAKPLFADD
jgi:hypothetical protein